MVTQHLKAPFPYFGGKQALAPRIVNLMPEHRVYVEVFGGAGSVLCAKPPTRLEVYNDIDSSLVNFFRVLRDKEQCAELIRLLKLTPYSREEFAYCRRQVDASTDPVERARCWFAAISQSFSGDLGNASWRHVISINGDANHPVSFRNNILRLDALADRFRTVEIEHNSFERIIGDYDGSETLFYCDPPYVSQTRKGGGYRHELSINDHHYLLELLEDCKGKVILSGYNNPLYAEKLVHWRRVDIEVYSSAVGVTKQLGLKGKGARQNHKRTECIWIKPNSERAGLWNSEATA